MRMCTSNQKYLVYVFVTLLITFGVKMPSYGQNLDVGEPRTVRMIYFLPNDRPFRQEVVDSMKAAIRYAQTLYAEQMQAHGYGNKTFHFETTRQDQPKVHRVDGKHPFSYYDNTLGSAVIEELEQTFDLGMNIYFIVLGADALRQGDGQPASGVGNQRGKNGGHAVVPNEFTLFTVAHELGHTFGLGHDFRDDSYLMSYGNRQDSSLSACAAEFLSVSPYFNASIPIAGAPPPTLELISSPTYLSGSKSTLVRLKVKAPGGIHQVQLFSHQGLQAYRGLAGKKEAIVEFEYDGVFGLADFISLSDAAAHSIFVKAVDTDGNVGFTHFTLSEISSSYITTLEGHTGEIRSVSFSPDGRTVASASGSMVTLWEIATGANIATFKSLAASVAFSPDGEILVSGGSDGIKLWEVATRRNIATLSQDIVRSVAFSPDGTTLASSGNSIELWDMSTRRNIATMGRKGMLRSFTSVAFSPDGTTLASGSEYHEIKLWDVATRRNIATMVADPPVVLSVAFSPDGTTLASSGNFNGIKLWDVATRRNIAILSQDIVLSVAFSPDGTTLASGHWGGEVGLWDVATGSQIDVFAHASQQVLTVAFSPDGTILASGGTEGMVNLWDVESILTQETKSANGTVPLPADVNEDGIVNIQDLVLVASNFSQMGENAADVNGDGIVNIQDLVLVAGAFGSGAAAAPALPLQAIEGFVASDVQNLLTQVREISLTDPAYLRGIAVLEQLLASLLPTEMALLSNYPNPFNPETWIPYQLAKSADVTLRIYAVNGALVRTLTLGHQSAGIYQNRSRAAYWDGKNELGEKVASGIYFYTLSADDFTATRKMLIMQ